MFTDRKLILLTATILPLLLVSGCGSDDDSKPVVAEAQPESAPAPAPSDGSAIPVVDACTIVTDDEIQEVLGAPTSERTSSTEEMPGMSLFSCSSDDVHVTVEALATPALALSSYNFGTTYPEIEGVGERARNTQPLGDIDVLVGSTIVSVDLFLGRSREEELEAGTQIAKIAVDRLR